MLLRVRAYTPNGASLGVLPSPLKVSASMPMNDQGGLTMEYGKAAARPEVLDSPVELALETSRDGQGWAEPRNGRFLYLRRGGDDVERPARVNAEALGYAWRLSTAKVLPFGALDSEGKRKFLSQTPGAIMKALFTEAKGRGALAGMSIDFSETVDSAGQPWSGVMTIYYEPGMDYLTLATNLADQGMVDFWTEGRTLRMFNADSAASARRLDQASTAVVLRQGRDLTEAPFRGTWENLADYAFILGDDGKTLEKTQTVTSPWGRQETFITNGGVSDEGTMNLLADSHLALAAEERVERTYGLTLSGVPFLPLLDYYPGDYVGIRHPGKTQASYRVRQVTLERDEKGTVSGNAVLNDRFLEAEVRQNRRVNGIVNGAQSSGGSGATPTPAPDAPDTTPPALPQAVTVVTDSYTTPQGDQRAVARMTWDPVTTNHNGSPTDDVDHYEVRWKAATALPKGDPTTLNGGTAHATLNAQWDRRSKAYGWVAGDGGASIRLASGKDLWVFSDSVLGTLDSQWRLKGPWGMVNNVLVETDPADRNGFRTLAGAKNLLPTSLAAPSVYPAMGKPTVRGSASIVPADWAYGGTAIRLTSNSATSASLVAAPTFAAAGAAGIRFAATPGETFTVVSRWKTDRAAAVTARLALTQWAQDGTAEVYNYGDSAASVSAASGVVECRTVITVAAGKTWVAPIWVLVNAASGESFEVADMAVYRGNQRHQSWSLTGRDYESMVRPEATGWRSADYLNHLEGLKAVLRQGGEKRVVQIGDSITEGVGVAQAASGVVSLLQAKVRAEFDKGATGKGYVPAAGHPWVSHGVTFSSPEPAINPSRGGLTGYTRTLDPGQWVEFPATACDSITVFYSGTNFFAGTLEVLVDGVVKATQWTFFDGYKSGQAITVTGLSSGNHTVRLRGKADTTGGSVVEGVLFRKGSNGVYLLNAGHAGGTIRNRLDGDEGKAYWESIAAVQPDHALAMFGSNDFPNRTADQFAQDAVDLVTKWKATAPGKTMSLVLWPEPATDPLTTPFSTYQAKVRERLAAEPLVDVVNLQDYLDVEERVNLATAPSIEPGSPGWSSNNTNNNTTAGDTSRAAYGSQSLRSTAAAGAVTVNLVSLYNVGGGTYPVNPGEKVTVGLSFSHNLPTEATARLYVSWLSSTSSQIAADYGGPMDRPIPAGEGFTRVSLTTGTPPAGAVSFRIIALLSLDRAVQAGVDYGWVDACTIERGVTDGSYFDGSNAPAGWRTQWEGAVNASRSMAVKTDWLGDGIHPNEAGAEKVATALFNRLDDPLGDYYWLGDGWTSGGKTYLQAQLMGHHWPTPSGWNFTFRGRTDLVVLDSNLRLEAVRPWITSPAGISWSDAAEVDGSWLYIFGHKADASACLMRVAVADPFGTAYAWNGTAWVADLDQAKSLVTAKTFSSVRKIGNTWHGYWVDGFSKYVNEATAPALTGPWTVQSTPVYRIPEVGGPNYAYIPRQHPQFDSSEGLVFGYSQNTSADWANKGVEHAGPRFARGPAAAAQAPDMSAAPWLGLTTWTEAMAAVSPLTPGSAFYAEVRAIDQAGNASATPAGSPAWTPVGPVVVGGDTTAPYQPSTPIVSGFFQGLKVYWDGLDSRGAPPSKDWRRVEVHVSAVDSFWPTPATYVGELPETGGTLPVHGLDAATAYYTRLVAVDNAGNRSDPSDQAESVTEQLVNHDLPDKLIQAANVAEGAISVRHLDVAGWSDSLAPNLDFEGDWDGDMPYGWTRGFWLGDGSVTSAKVTGAESIAGDVSWKLTVPNGQGRMFIGPVQPAVQRTIYYFAIRLKTSRAVKDGLDFGLAYGSTPEEVSGWTRLGLVNGPILSSDGTTTFYGRGELPAGAKFAAPVIIAYPETNQASPYTITVGEVEWKKIVGGANLAEASIYNAHISYLDLNEGNVSSLTAGKITTGTMSALITLSGEFRSTDGAFRAGNYGVRTYDSSGDLVTEMRSSDGGLVSKWIRTSTSGPRIEMGTYGMGAGSALISFFSDTSTWQFPPAIGYGGGGRQNLPGIGIHAGSVTSSAYNSYGMNMMAVDQQGGITLVTGNKLDGAQASQGAPITLDAGGSKGKVDLLAGVTDRTRLLLSPNVGASRLSLNEGTLNLMGETNLDSYTIRLARADEWSGFPVNHVVVTSNQGFRVATAGASQALTVSGGGVIGGSGFNNGAKIRAMGGSYDGYVVLFWDGDTLGMVGYDAAGNQKKVKAFT